MPVSKKRILLVEDNSDNMTLITDLLQTLEYVVLQAGDGETGVALAEAEQPDLILMDLSLPVMDGWTATRHLKSNPALEHIPIIALTAHAMVGDREKALAAGCDDYLTKPIDFEPIGGKNYQLDDLKDTIVRVLVAEDNPNSRQLVKDILESIGYEPVLTADGPSAVQAAQSNPPDLIILDVNMPGMSGFDVLAILKNDENLAHIPVLMLTALADIDNRVTGLGLGADDYLSKPFSPRELAARIDARLRTKAEADNLRQTKEMVRKTFERFVAPSVVEKLLQDPTQVKLGGQLQEVTVMFSDLEGFTTLSEFTQPELLLGVLNQYHALVVSMIQSNGGTVDKFIGDGVMSLYNTPLAQSDHALRATKTAVQIRNALPDFYEQFDPGFRIGINFGIHSGLAVVGNVGTHDLMEFTAVGDTVNLASRLQGMSSGGKILISQATYDQIADYAQVNPVGHRNVKGREESVMVYEVLDTTQW